MKFTNLSRHAPPAAQLQAVWPGRGLVPKPVWVDVPGNRAIKRSLHRAVAAAQVRLPLDTARSLGFSTPA